MKNLILLLLAMMTSLSMVYANDKKTVVDPGEEGMKTLAGIDVDQDGIRDDIQIWIDKDFPVDTKPSTNKALKQYAKYSQLALINDKDSRKRREYKLKVLESYDCLYWVTGFEKALHLSKIANVKFNNTSERLRVYLMTEKQFYGSGRPISKKEARGSEYILCEFNASKESLGTLTSSVIE